MKNTEGNSLARGREEVEEQEKSSLLNVAAPDWHALAEQRLKRLVEVEYDQAQVGKRLAALQLDYRELLLTSEMRLQEIQVMRRRFVVLEEQLQSVVKHQKILQESRSWRVTRPLRALSRAYSFIKNRLRRIYR